jgi:hypothetical protein
MAQQLPDRPPPQKGAPASRLSPVAAELLKAAETRLAAARGKVDETAKRAQAGAATEQELVEAKAAFAEAEANLAAVSQQANHEKIETALRRRVTVTFDDTPVRRAVELLQQGGPLDLRVDPKAPDATITLRAQDETLEAILGAIGEQTGLAVEPDRLGFVLREQPSLALDAPAPSPERSKLLEALGRPVDVQMKDATVTQAAEALSKASGTPITVDEGIKTEKRVTAEAHGIPLRSVLEAIARPLSVMIAPGPDSKGVILKAWPSLEVNGERTVVAGRSSPWSNEWGPVPPGGFELMNWIRAGGTRGVGDFFPSPSPGPRTSASGRATGVYMAPNGVSAWGSVGGAVSVSASGNLVIVAEPGSGPNGERGFWLTVYRLEGGNLEKVASSFHQSAGARQPAAPKAGRTPGADVPAPPKGTGTSAPGP